MFLSQFQLYLKRGVLQVNDEEVILHSRQEEAARVLSEEFMKPLKYDVAVQTRMKDVAFQGSNMTLKLQKDNKARSGLSMAV